MKHFLFVAITILSITGCRKQDNTRHPYNGTYELRSEVTISGLTEYPRGNGNTIRFDGDEVTWQRAGRMLLKSQFTLHRETFPYVEPARLMDRLRTPDFEIFVERSNDTLSIYPVYFSEDASGSTYIRIR